MARRKSTRGDESGAFQKFMARSLEPVPVSTPTEERIDRLLAGTPYRELEEDDLWLLLQMMLRRRGIGNMEPEGDVIAHLRARARRSRATHEAFGDARVFLRHCGDRVVGPQLEPVQCFRAQDEDGPTLVHIGRETTDESLSKIARRYSAQFRELVQFRNSGTAGAEILIAAMV